MSSKPKFGIVASIVTVVWAYVSAIGIAIVGAALVSSVFAFATGVIYNLCIAPVTGWPYAPFSFVWALFMLSWMVALWFKNYTSKKES